MRRGRKIDENRAEISEKYEEITKKLREKQHNHVETVLKKSVKGNGTLIKSDKSISLKLKKKQ